MLDKRAKNGWIYVLPTLPAIAWLLNFRCPGDIPYCPVAYAYLVFTRDKCAVFLDSNKLDDDLRAIWAKDNIELHEYGVEEVGKYVKSQVEAIQDGNEKRKIKVFAPKECSWALAKACSPVGHDQVIRLIYSLRLKSSSPALSMSSKASRMVQSLKELATHI